MQFSLDSIMEVRTLNRQDSIKFKSLLNPQNLHQANQAQNKVSKSIDKPTIYKTPMKTEK
jgi:hypothetical protein